MDRFRSLTSISDLFLLQKVGGSPRPTLSPISDLRVASIRCNSCGPTCSQNNRTVFYLSRTAMDGLCVNGCLSKARHRHPLWRYLLLLSSGRSLLTPLQDDGWPFVRHSLARRSKSRSTFWGEMTPTNLCVVILIKRIYQYCKSRVKSIRYRTF